MVSYENQVSSEFYCLLTYGQTCSVLLEVHTYQEIPWKCVGGTSSVQALSVQSVTDCGTQLSSSSMQLVMVPSVDNIVRSSVNVTVDIAQVDVVDGQRVNETLLNVFTVSIPSPPPTFFFFFAVFTFSHVNSFSVCVQLCVYMCLLQNCARVMFLSCFGFLNMYMLNAFWTCFASSFSMSGVNNGLRGTLQSNF